VISGQANQDMEREFLAQLPTIERLIAFVARRYHLSHSDAEDFASQVKLRLIADDYAILREFRGRSTLRTFLTTVVTRMCLDFRISTMGKWRPSAQAKRAGPVGVLLERLLLRDGHSFEVACEMLVSNHQIPLSRAAIEDLAGRLPARSRRRFESVGALADWRSPEPPADEAISTDEHRRKSAEAVEVLREAKETLDPEDQLILALRFEDGCKIADIAVILCLEVKPLYARVERLKTSLRALLESRGIDASIVRNFVDDGEQGANP